MRPGCRRGRCRVVTIVTAAAAADAATVASDGIGVEDDDDTAEAEAALGRSDDPIRGVLANATEVWAMSSLSLSLSLFLLLTNVLSHARGAALISPQGLAVKASFS